jgi:Asp/Glu/hydantoin racemase
VRIWYQYPAPITPFRSVVFDLVRAAIDRVRRPDTVVDVKPASKGAPRTRLYALEYVQLHTAVEMVETLAAAADQGYDGAIIGQSLDPGLQEAKELLDIPVVGIMESAAHVASLWGERFGIVTIPNPPPYPAAKYPATHKRNLDRYGFGQRLVAADSIQLDLDEMTQDIQSGRHERIVEEFHAAARRCYAQGADTIIAGDTIISIVMVAQNALVVPGTSQPIVDLITSGVKVCEALVDLHQSLGIVRSRAGRLASPDAADLAAAFETFRPAN